MMLCRYLCLLFVGVMWCLFVVSMVFLFVLCCLNVCGDVLLVLLVLLVLCVCVVGDMMCWCVCVCVEFSGGGGSVVCDDV